MLAFILTFLIAALAGVGVGGGGLYILYLTAIEKLPQLQAQGLNLLFFITSAGTSLLFHFQKRKLNFPLILLISAVGIPGSLLGSFLASRMDTDLLSKAFGIFLLLCGTRTLFGKRQH